ncbi:MAG TPA: threonine/serine dehydratase [Vicinamibacterales bacterium]
MPDLLSLDEIRAAAIRISGVTRVTPLLEARELKSWGGSDGVSLLLKCENLQVGGAFKIRGAYNMAAGLPESTRRAGLLTYSSGNHGLAIALTARRLGIPAVIVMPTTASAMKVEGARALGAEVLFEGTTTIERRTRAEAEAARRGLTIVPPFDHLQIAAGQGTIGLEILEQCPMVATVYVQMSGGGLISGIATALKRSRPSVCVVGVEPAGVARMTASLAAGHPVTIPITPGIADGLLAVRPGDITFPHVQAFVDRVVTVDDPAIIGALQWLFREAKLVAEPSGAITVAAALADAAAGRLAPRGPTVAVISGGNVEKSAFARYLASDPAI